MIDGAAYATHRLVWFYVHGKWPEHEIDHINGDRSDNRISNLRDVPAAINRQNLRTSHKDKIAGPLGAHFNKVSRKWKASICVNYRHTHLGTFATAEDAHAAYVAAKRMLHAGCAI